MIDVITEDGCGQATFSTRELADLVKAKVSEVHYWVRTGLLSPSIKQSHMQGDPRVFSSDDVMRALFVHCLRKAEWKPKEIQTALAYFRKVKENPQEFKSPVLVHEGRSLLILCKHHSGNPALLDAKKPGQLVLTIALETLEEETRKLLASSK